MKSKIVEANKKIEDRVVNGFSKIEDRVVNGFSKIEDSFINRYLLREGESIEEAKERLKKEEQDIPEEIAKVYYELKAMNKYTGRGF